MDYMAYKISGPEMKEELAKSHDLGRLTDRLGFLFYVMVQKYAMKGNWRGYSYVEDMEGAALTQLCAVWQKYDMDSKSSPFSYFTTVIHNSFLQYLQKEKRQQRNRDDLLIANGVLPSWARQMEDEFAQKELLQ